MAISTFTSAFHLLPYFLRHEGVSGLLRTAECLNDKAIRKRNMHNAYHQPFFIIGSGRSGNTLLRSRIIANSYAIIPPEFYLWRPLATSFLKGKSNLRSSRVKLLSRSLITGKGFDTWGLSEENLIQLLEDLLPEPFSLADLIDSLYRAYAIHQGEEQPFIWGDKTPANTLNVWLIASIFPNARFIHMIRDGRDVALSYVNSGLISELEEALARWYFSCKHAQEFGNQIPSSQYLEVRYEDLVNQETAEMESVFRFLDLEPSTRTSSHQQVFAAMGDTTAFPHHKNVSKPTFSSSIGKWKENLNPDQVENIHERYGGFLNHLGYESGV